VVVRGVGEDDEVVVVVAVAVVDAVCTHPTS
jgi:hypothetical protein